MHEDPPGDRTLAFPALPTRGWRGVRAPPPETASVCDVGPTWALAVQLRGRGETELCDGICPPPSFPQRRLPLSLGPPRRLPRGRLTGPVPCSAASRCPKWVLAGVSGRWDSLGPVALRGQALGWALVSSQRELKQLHSHPHTLTPPLPVAGSVPSLRGSLPPRPQGPKSWPLGGSDPAWLAPLSVPTSHTPGLALPHSRHTVGAQQMSVRMGVHRGPRRPERAPEAGPGCGVRQQSCAGQGMHLPAAVGGGCVS